MNREAEELFHQIADLSPAERGAWFREHSVTPDLRAEVERLLAFDDAGAVITDCVAASAEHLLNLGAAEPDRRCGPYRLIRVVGRGGMGAVYLAERADGEVEQRVAIKFLRYYSGEPTFRDRFLRERQILAALNHPGIARLLDAGHTSDAQPYLVMEYIDGQPIDVYAARCDLRAKLRLFLRVCEAVSYAHRNLIIHRDLKPSNILVDSSGAPKLLDFGIAKILDDAADQTGTRDLLLTPEYASPEQVRGTAHAVTSDIYSLGAILYKLLAGRSPHANASESRQGIEFAVCSLEPAPPSSINPAIPRDLDCIVAKALRKEPAARYSSVDALAEDIGALLESRPVRARSGNAWYRTRKFLRRYWIPVAASALVIASLSTSLYIAMRERTIAQQRFSDLRQLSNKLFDLDVQARDLPGSTKLRQVIVDTALDYLRRLSANVHGDPELALEVGNAYMRVARVQGVPISPTLGQQEQAEKNLLLAQKFVESALSARPANRMAMLRLAQIAHDRMILARYKTHSAEALALARTSADWLEKFNAGPGDRSEMSAILNTYLNVADQFNSRQLYDQALQLCRRGRDLAVLYHGKQEGTFLWVAAQVYQQRGDLDQALAASRDAVRLLDPGSDWLTKGGQTGNFQLALVAEGRILADPNTPNLRRPEEALAVLDRAFRLVDELVHRDPSDHSNIGHMVTAALPMTRILRAVDSNRTLEVIDHALGHLAQVGDDTHLQRYQVDLLAGSVYPLVELKRFDEAKRRLDRAFEGLRQLKFYPAERLFPNSDATAVIQALARYDSATGDVAAAAREYDDLLQRLQPAKSGLRPDLHDAILFSEIYAAADPVYRIAGRFDKAAEIEGRWRDLWQGWDGKLPHNDFVLARLAQSQSTQTACAPDAASSLRSQAWANRSSRLTACTERLRAAADSSAVMPPK
jgi:serine/threonine protein kinase